MCMDEIAIIFCTAHFIPFALSRALLTIRKAFLFGALERSLLKPRCPDVRSGPLTC